MASGALQRDVGRWHGVQPGLCCAWPLPADATCATVARQALRDAVSDAGLEPGLVEDCVLMASELAANTLHAQVVAEAGGGGNRLASATADVEGEPIQSAGPAPRTPKSRHRPSRVPRLPQAAGTPRRQQAEIWLYPRGLRVRRELVCKVFDCCRGWRDGY